MWLRKKTAIKVTSVIFVQRSQITFVMIYSFIYFVLLVEKSF
jgi:hypothetical protein